MAISCLGDRYCTLALLVGINSSVVQSDGEMRIWLVARGTGGDFIVILNTHLCVELVNGTLSCVEYLFQTWALKLVLFLPLSSFNILVLQGLLAKTKVAAANNKSLTHRSQAVGTECPSGSRLRVESLLRPSFTTRDEQPLSWIVKVG